MAPFLLRIPRTQFIEGLRPFQKLRHVRGHASLSFNGVFAVFDTVQAGASLPAIGTWPGVVQFSARFLQALAQLPPRDNPVEVHFAEGKLRIGTTWVEAHSKPQGAAPNADDWRLANNPTPDLFARDREKQIHTAAQAAYPHLAPLGVSCADIEQWLRSKC